MSFDKAILIAACALVVGITGVTLNNQWSLSASVGEFRSEIEDQNETPARIEGQIGELRNGFEAGLNNLRESVRKANQDIFVVASEIDKMNADVSSILATAGIQIDSDIEFVPIDGQFIALPITDEAHEDLISRGWAKVNLTPVLTGFALDESSASIIQAAVEEDQLQRQRMMLKPGQICTLDGRVCTER